MERINWAEELRQRGFKLTPLPPPTPEQMEDIQKISKDVSKFLKMMDEAHKASKKSTLRFATRITRHSGRYSPTPKIRQKNKE